jgi:hypothetical protein
MSAVVKHPGRTYGLLAPTTTSETSPVGAMVQHGGKGSAYKPHDADDDEIHGHNVVQ